MALLRELIQEMKTKLDTIAENAKPFDVHDDIAVQNASPANADRIPSSDESGPGDPNEYFRLDILRGYFRRDAQQTFDLIESLLPEGLELRTAQETFDLIEDLLPEGGDVTYRSRDVCADTELAQLQRLVEPTDYPNAIRYPRRRNDSEHVPVRCGQDTT